MVFVTVGQLVGVLLTSGVRDSVSDIFAVELREAVAVGLFDTFIEDDAVVELVIVFELVIVLDTEADDVAVFELVVVSVVVFVTGTDFETSGDKEALGDAVPVLEPIVDLDNVGVAVFVLETLAE